MNWLPVKGFEGLYEVSKDGKQVRSTQRLVRFGLTSRIKNPKILEVHLGRYYQLTKNGNKYQVKLEDIHPSAPAIINPSDWRSYPAHEPVVGKNYQVCIYFGQHTFFMFGTFDGKYWRNSQGRRFKTGYVKKFRSWNKDFEE